MTTGSSFFGNKGEREWEEGEEKIKVEGKREGKREEGGGREGEKKHSAPI